MFLINPSRRAHTIILIKPRYIKIIYSTWYPPL